MSYAILVVDDNDATRALVRDVAEREGMRCVEARLGAEARDLVERLKPDAILLDLGLPDVSGADLVEELRERVGVHVPILALTGIASAEARLAFAAFDQVVTKPLESTRLLAALRACLPESQEAARSFGKGKRLVVADDDAVQRKMVAFKLGRLGFQVLTAADGKEALDLVRTERPDAVVSDVLMPNIDGFELCAELRADPAFARTPILLLSNSYIEESDHALARRIGADAYVIRHPELTELTDSLRRVLEADRVHAPPSPHVAPDALRERSERAVRQLDRQVAQNAALAQRTATLAAELAILGGLTSALAENRDVDAAMSAALGSCFDAGNISWGVLFVREDDAWKQRSLGLDAARTEALARATDRIMGMLRTSSSASVGGPSSRGGGARAPQIVDLGDLLGEEALGGFDARSTLLAPIVHQNEWMGAILLGSRTPFDEQRSAFAGVVAGQTALVLALARAFQERERASARERERAEQLAGIFEAIGEPILLLDRACRPLRWNQAGQPFAINASDPHVEKWPETHGLYRADQSTLYDWSSLPLVRASRGEVIDGAEICVRKNGEEARWLSINARPVRGADAELAGAVAVIRDVTHAKRAQEAQIVSDRMASIGVLAAGIAHEINNPMTSVLAEIDMAIEDVPPEDELRERLRAARDAAVRVTTIVRDLKTLSRGGSSDEINVVDLRRVLDAAVRMAVPETRPRAVVDVEIEDVPRVLGNEARLVQVVLNLLVNAAQSIAQAVTERGADPLDATVDKFGRLSSRDFIHVRAGFGHDGGALIAIADSGIGIRPEVRARLFTPFFTTKPVGAGSGLGLSISHRIVSELGGTIECDSTPGQGAVFRIWLPAAADGGVTTARSAPGSESGRPRVLAVDADPLARQIVARGLRATCDVVLCDSSDTAASRMSAGEPFDLVLWAVPSAAGVAEVIENVAASNPGKVSALTLLVPRNVVDYAERAADARGCAALAKPFDAASVARFVKARMSALGWRETRS